MPLDFSILNQSGPVIQSIADLVKSMQNSQELQQRERISATQFNQQDKQLKQDDKFKTIQANQNQQTINNDLYKTRAQVEKWAQEGQLAEKGYALDVRKAEHTEQKDAASLQLDKERLATDQLKNDQLNQRGLAQLEINQAAENRLVGKDTREATDWQTQQKEKQLLSEKFREGGMNGMVEALGMMGRTDDAAKLGKALADTNESLLKGKGNLLDYKEKKRQLEVGEKLRVADAAVSPYIYSQDKEAAKPELLNAISRYDEQFGTNFSALPEGARIAAFVDMTARGQKSLGEIVQNKHSREGYSAMIGAAFPGSNGGLNVKPASQVTQLEKLQTLEQDLNTKLQSTNDPAQKSVIINQRNQVQNAISKLSTPYNDQKVDNKDDDRVLERLDKNIEASQQRAQIAAMIDGAAETINGNSTMRPGSLAPEQMAALVKAFNGTFGTNIAAQDISQVELIKMLHAQMAVGMRAVGSGSTSDFEMKTYMERNPGMETSPKGIKKIASWLKYQDEANSSQKEFFKAYRAEHGNLRGADYAWRKFKEDNVGVDADGNLDPSKLYGWESYLFVSPPKGGNLSDSAREQLKQKIAEREAQSGK